MVASVRRAWRTAKNVSANWVVWARNTAVKIVLLTALATFQLWLAFFMYGTFYYAYMPTELHAKPVYLDFGLCDRFDGSPSCPFPQTNITLVKDPGRERLFMPGQKYLVRLEIEMPESPVNEHLGVFMVKMETYSKSDEIIARSSRPTMLRYRSPFLKMLDVIFLAPLFVTGYSEEKQNLHIDLMNDFIDNAYKPSVKVGLEIRAKQLELYSAMLKIHAQFTGLRYLMFYWPLTSAMFSVMFNFAFLSVLSVMMWQQCVSFLLHEPGLEEREYPAVPELSYEERRRLARQSMDQERSSLFRGRPPHVTIIDPLDPPSSQRALSQPSSSHRPGSPSKSHPQRNVRGRGARTHEGGAENPPQEGPSSGVSSDNSDSNGNGKGGEKVVETLKGEESASGSSQGSMSTETEELPSGNEKDEGEDRDTDTLEEGEGRGPGRSAGSSGSHGILRHRSVTSP